MRLLAGLVAYSYVPQSGAPQLILPGSLFESGK
jgi:hypothetical protein